MLWNSGVANKHDNLETRVTELEALTTNQKTLVDKLFKAVKYMLNVFNILR